jgi:hypothetical protein
MYGLAYVILPRTFSSLQAELDRTLAPFKRGGEKDFPREKLEFEDATERIERLHRARFRFNAGGSMTWLDGDAEASFDLRAAKLVEYLAACRLDHFEGSFAEIEPDFQAFVRGFTIHQDRDPATGRYGRWLNPIGMWDWWDLGGRFNGFITGERRPAAADSTISSGPSPGRLILDNLAEALGAATDTEAAAIEANVELIETLKSRPGDHALPTAIVLPPGCCTDADRWFDRIEWHEISPGTRAALGTPANADFHELARAAYDRFSAHAAAGVAYHF